MDIAIVTAVWGNYGQYLPEWVDSIVAQTVQPREVVIVDAGLSDDHIVAALEALEDSGLDWRYAQIPYTGVGDARNIAVQWSTTPWVMHLDADDLLLPTALEDAAALADQADVIAIGAIRDGKPQTFTRSSRRSVLAGILSCYSCSPFRRELWERRPYITVNDWVDSAFWVGLAHLGARFVGTDRPGFVYRAHPDSHSKTMTREQKHEAMVQFHRLLRGWDL